ASGSPGRVGRRSRESGETAASRRLGGLLQLRERRRRSPGIVLEVGVEEFEPARAVQAAGHRRRKGRDGLLRQRLHRDKGAAEHDKKDREAESGGRKAEAVYQWLAATGLFRVFLYACRLPPPSSLSTSRTG